MKRHLQTLLLYVWAVVCLWLPRPLATHAQHTPPSQPLPADLAKAADLAKRLPNHGKLPASFPAARHNWGRLALDRSNLLTGTQTRQKAPRRQASVASTSSGTPIWANVIYSTAWSGEAENGFYSFGSASSSDEALTPVAVESGIFATYGGAIYDGVFHGIYTVDYFGYTIPVYAEYTTEDWQPTSLNGKQLDDYSMLSIASAYDPTTGRLYGNFYTTDASAKEFGYADFSGFTHVAVGADLGDDLAAMACSADGQLYALTTGGTLYKVDKASGAKTKVGDTGVTAASYMQGAVADPKTGTIYWAPVLTDESSALYAVDPATAQATQVRTFPNEEELVCLYIPESAADDAPAAPADLAVHFDKGNTTGQVTFTVPSTTSAGATLTGQVNYTILCGDQELTGTAQPGEAVSRDLTLPQGKASLSVQLSNEAGKSARAKVDFYVGYDTPLPVTDLTFTADKGSGSTYTAKLSWTAPAGGTNGGYLDTDALTYTVVRYPGKTTVAEGLKATSFTEQLTASDYDLYYYTVTATNHGLPTVAVESNKLALGDALELPYHEDFNDGGFAKYLVVDANNDGTTWKESGKSARYDYSAFNDADDWLMTPPLKLDADHVYELSYAVSGNPYYVERYAVAFGQGEDPTTYTTLLEPTDIAAGTDGQTVRLNFRPAQSGTFRMAFHALSAAGHYTFSIDDVDLQATGTVSSPDSVTTLKVEAAAAGAPQAKVSFNAPTKTIEGQPLSSLTKIVVSRGNEEVYTFDAPAPGAALSFTDDAATQGFTTYSVAPYNESGKGYTASQTVYVGTDTPQAPASVTLEDNLDGTASLAWQAPADKGANGGYVNAADLTYTVYAITSVGYLEPLFEGLTTTSCTIPDVATTGSQSMLRYTVRAFNGDLKSEYAVSNTLVVGANYDLPFSDSFANGTTDKYWSVSSTGDNTFSIVADPTADNDNGAAQFTAAQAGDASTLSSGKIALKGAQKPSLSFSYYAVPGADVKLTAALKFDGKQTTPVTVSDIDYSTLTGEAGWRQVSVDLSEAAADHTYGQLLFTATVNDGSTPVGLDAFSVSEQVEHNLAIAWTDVPATVKAGNDLTVKATVANNGSLKADGYKVALYVNDQRAAEQAGTPLEPGAKATFDLTYTVKPDAPEQLTVYAVAEYDADESPANNTTDERTVQVKQSTYPAVTDLAATAGADGVKLTWSRPATDGGLVTEGFENYEPLSITDFGDWTAIDGDGQVCYGINGAELSHDGEPRAFQIYNTTGIDALSGEAYQPYEGKQALIAFSATQGASDDWLISTPLSGKAFDVTLMANAWSVDYANETFEILYSTTGNAPADFKVAQQFEVTTTGWNKYTASIPEGAKYFALHYTTTDGFLLMFDNLTYEGSGYELTGYNVYRDGEKIATASADATSFTDETAQAASSYTYHISAVYTVGESALSNAASVTTGIEQVESGAVKVYGLKGAVAVDGARNLSVQVYGADGRLLLTALPASDHFVATLPAGTYVVKVANTIYKVMAR